MKRNGKTKSSTRRVQLILLPAIRTVIIHTRLFCVQDYRTHTSAGNVVCLKRHIRLSYGAEIALGSPLNTRCCLNGTLRYDNVAANISKLLYTLWSQSRARVCRLRLSNGRYGKITDTVAVKKKWLHWEIQKTLKTARKKQHFAITSLYFNFNILNTIFLCFSSRSSRQKKITLVSYLNYT